MKSSRRETLLSLLLITLTTLLTYAAYIPQLGFYRDDWYLVWMAQARGMQGMLGLFVGDRPFVGWLYVLDFSMLGTSPLAWHIYALIVKLISGLAFFWLVRSLWEDRKIETTFITLLFVVYPGFYQQPNALTFKQLIIAYAAAMLSLAFTVNAVKARSVAVKILFTVLALLLGAFYIFIYEALVGLEVVRLMLLAYLFYQQHKTWRENLRSSLVYILPYFVFAAIFVFWRIFLFDSTRKATSVGELAGHYTSLHGLLGLSIETVKDLLETSLFAWSVPFYQMSNQVVYKELGLAFALGAAVLMLGAGYYFLARHSQPSAESESQTASNWLALGAAIIFITTLPIVAAGRNVIFGIQWDRYTYQSIIGVALLMGGIIFYALKGWLRWVVLALLILSGVMTQSFSAASYRNYWKAERDVWWQLSWRAPQIQEGATLILSTPGSFAPAEEYEVWSPANMVYYPKQELKLAGQIMSDKLWVDVAHGTQEQRLVRGTITVNRNYEKIIVLSQPAANSCLHVLDGSRASQVVTESADVRQIAPYSNVGLINTSAAPMKPPAEIFGSEPVHNWCYYYQKIDLARQNQDWQTAAKLADEASARGLAPSDLSEWLPVLEAYLHIHDAAKIKHAAQMLRIDKTIIGSLCQNYKNAQNESADHVMIFNALCAR